MILSNTVRQGSHGLCTDLAFVAAIIVLWLDIWVGLVTEPFHPLNEQLCCLDHSSTCWTRSNYEPFLERREVSYSTRCNHTEANLKKGWNVLESFPYSKLQKRQIWFRIDEVMRCQNGVHGIINIVSNILSNSTYNAEKSPVWPIAGK